MKTIQSLLIPAVAALALASPLHVAHASPEMIRDVRVGLSVHYSDAMLPLVRTNLVNLCLTSPANTRLCLDDTATLRTIASLEIPVLKIPSPENLLKCLSRPLSGLAAWFKTLKERPSPPPLKDTADLNLLEYLWHISEQPAPGRRSIVLIGSALNASPAEPAWGFANQKYPTPGCIRTNMAACPYGCADRQGRLTNCIVHLCYLDERLFPNPNYKAKVRHFWAQWVAAQGGTLASFTPDLGQAMANALRTDLRPVVQENQNEPRDDRVGMAFAPPRDLPEVLGRILNLTSAASTNAAQPRGEMTLPPELARVNGIGLMWSEAVDIDLYTRANPGSPEVFFGQKTAPQLKYYHDYTQANVSFDYEFVEFTAPVDIGRVQAWANLFAGATPNASGKVAVFWNGRAYYSTFKINATRGNGGTDRAARDRSPHWTRLDPARIVGLSQ